MELIYYPDHEQRYAHLPPDERPGYPDEIWIGGLHIKRQKRFEDIKPGETASEVSTLLYAIDVPIHRALN
ncbi:hypothetical protein HY250_02015 [Candidatus Azambacteria bacterium]|nr:hypothetical protein [Candidatus Azambacteria bacterium]